MLTRRSAQTLRSLTNPSVASFVRPYTASASQCAPSKAPALADIRPDGAAAFDAKQEQFREQLAASQRRKDQEESQSRLSASRGSKSSSSSTTPQGGDGDSHSSSSVIDGIDKTLSSLSFAHAEDARAREQAAQETGKKGGPLSSLFYGTPEGRQLDKDIEQSFSQVLARGKYVHSIVFHEVYPDKIEEYVKLVGDWYPNVAKTPENKVNLVGSWRTEVGDCDTFGLFHKISA